MNEYPARPLSLAVAFLLTLTLGHPARGQVPWKHTFIGGAGERLGFSLASAGDFDGDGSPDLVVGSPGLAVDVCQASSLRGDGRVSVFSGTSGAELFTLAGQNQESLGYSVAGAGDVDADGVDDIIVGAPNRYGNDWSAGRVLVISGATHAILHEFSTNGGCDQMGFAVAGAGDVNLDGHDDLLIGVPGKDTGSLSDNGRVQVRSGLDGSVLYNRNGTKNGELLGLVVAGVGDVNGDGRADFAAFGLRVNQNADGIVRVYSGKNGNQLWSQNGSQDFQNFGISLAGAGDVDGDGLADLLIGAPGENVFEGRAYVVRGNDGSTIQQLQSNRPGAVHFGDRVSAGFSMDADLIPDLLVYERGIGLGQGVLHAFAGLDFERIGEVGGLQAQSMALLGDVDGDNDIEIAVGDATEGVGTSLDLGRVRVLVPARRRGSREGVVLSELVSKPNTSLGIAGGEFIEILNRNSPLWAYPADLSGYQLKADSGSTFTLPAGTILAGGQFLVVDLSAGIVAAKVPAATQAMVIQAPFANNFFENGSADGMSDALALYDTTGQIIDAVLWTDDAASLPAGAVAQDMLAQSAWGQDDFVANTFYPGYGDIGFARTNAFQPNLRQASNWAEGNAVGPTPGSIFHWTGHEDTLDGHVLDPDGQPLVGATVSIPGLVGTPGGPAPTGTSDSNGYYFIEGIFPGTYNVKATLAGHVTGWGVIEKKSPQTPYKLDFLLQPIDATTTTTATIGPAGGTITDPQGRFEVTFPRQFLSTATQISVTWLKPGLHPLVMDSVAQYEVYPGFRMALAATGGLHVSPHIPRSASGAKIQVRTLYPDAPSFVQTGHKVAVEVVNGDGSIDAWDPVAVFDNGQLERVGGDIFAVYEVAHFSDTLTLFPVMDGWTTPDPHFNMFSADAYYYAQGPHDCDVNQDGALSAPPDTLIKSYTLCPGVSFQQEFAVAHKTVVSESTQWKLHLEYQAQASAQFKVLIAKVTAQAGWKAGGEYSRGTETTNEVAKEEKLTLKADYPPTTSNPPDQYEMNFWAKYNVTYWFRGDLLEPTVWEAHGGGYQPFGDVTPLVTTIVPTGFCHESKVVGHCP